MASDIIERWKGSAW